MDPTQLPEGAMTILAIAYDRDNKELAKNIVRNFNVELESKIGKNRIEDFFKTINDIISIAEERNKLIKQN